MLSLSIVTYVVLYTVFDFSTPHPSLYVTDCVTFILDEKGCKCLSFCLLSVSSYFSLASSVMFKGLIFFYVLFFLSVINTIKMIAKCSITSLFVWSVNCIVSKETLLFWLLASIRTISSSIKSKSSLPLLYSVSCNFFCGACVGDDTVDFLRATLSNKLYAIKLKVFS